MKAIFSYLKNYAEPQVASLHFFPRHIHYQHVAVMPVYCEESISWQRFADQFDASHLLILVVNQPDRDLDISPQQNLVCCIQKTTTHLWSSQGLALYAPRMNHAHILVVDCFHHPLPVKQGVGLARKIGCDLATQLYHIGSIRSPWIGSIDADSRLPEDYFKQQEVLELTDVGAVYRVEHVGSDHPLFKATKHYERALQYYVDGLHFAGSKYAYWMIGSALLFHVRAYCQVRGFPKRAAGEDFYLLNKLIKQGRIRHFDQCTIEIEARYSHRVPFGTGTAAEKINQLHSINDFVYYDQQVFIELKSVLDWFKQLAFDPLSWLQGRFILSQESWEALTVIHFPKMVMQQLKQNITQAQWSHQLFVWFDAFKTMKFIHYLTERAYPKKPFKP
tara:strand:- start:49 stop:1218 length:1170 start_codon:yes stop_codon:yes gene_type:complete